MNNIFHTQNKKENVELLCAQKRLYSEAKKINMARLVMATAFALLSPIIARSNYTGYYLSFFAILYFIFDIAYLKRKECSKKLFAAKIQEVFDCDVLELKWNTILAEHKPEPEDICKALKKYLQKKSTDGLKNWYFSENYNLEIEISRALCQRSNISWDSNLRKIYARILLIILSFISISFLLSVIYLKFDIGKVISLTCFLLPLFYFFLEQIIGNFETSRDLDSARKISNEILEKIKTLPKTEAEQTARALQDRIFTYRKSNPLIPDKIYYLYRTKQQQEMDFSLEKAAKTFDH